MKFSNIANAVALIGSAQAATYSNTSYVPSADGYFHDGSIYFDIVLPNSGFSSFTIGSDADSSANGFVFSPNSLSGVYSPSGTPFDVTSSASAGGVDISADVDMTEEDTAALISVSGTLETEQSEYVGLFLVVLEGLPAPIVKRDDQTFTITVTATSSNPAESSAPTSSPISTPATSDDSTKTETDTTVVTITSCSDDKCNETTETLAPVPSSEVPITKTHTVESTTLVTITSCEDDKCTEVPVPTGVTVVTEEETIYTTYCPLTSEETTVVTATSIVKTTVCTTESTKTEGDHTVTEKYTYTTTVCDYYTTVVPKSPKEDKLTTITPTTTAPPKAPTTVAPPKAPTTAPPKAPTEAPETTLSSSATVVVPSTSLPEFAGSAAKIANQGSLFAVAVIMISALF